MSFRNPGDARRRASAAPRRAARIPNPDAGSGARGGAGPAAALVRVVERLRCPLCRSPLSHRGAALVCRRGHAHRIGPAGVAVLRTPRRRGTTGDTAAMVAARAAFLDRGHFAPLAEAIAAAARAAAAAPAEPGCVLDVGAGTGHHLASVLDALPAWSGLALDASRSAASRAVRTHPHAAAVVADAWQPLPLRDGAVDLVVNAFAPRGAPELRRVLAPGGALLLATPTSRHLEQLVGALGLLSVAPDKRERVAAQFGPLFAVERSETVEHELTLDHEDMRALVQMGPSAHHVGEAVLERRLAELPSRVATTVSVRVETYR